MAVAPLPRGKQAMFLSCSYSSCPAQKAEVSPGCSPLVSLPARHDCVSLGPASSDPRVPTSRELWTESGLGWPALGTQKLGGLEV